MILFITMIFLGLTGSVHCAVMCGPLCMALPLHRDDKRRIIAQSFIYHLSRIGGYTLLGLTIGLAGQALVFMKLQNIFILGSGILFLVWGIFGFLKKRFSFHFLKQPFQPSLIKNLFSQFINRSGILSLIVLGVLNGLIPCGLVYAALALSMQNFTIHSTALNMVGFGLGTLPMMVGLTAGWAHSNKQFKKSIDSISPFIFLAIGTVMLYRGLSMQMPDQLSLWESLNYPIMCH